MKAPITMNQAQVYGISKQNSKEIFQFFRKILAVPGKFITCVLTAVTNSWNKLGIRTGMICRNFPFQKCQP